MVLVNLVYVVVFSVHIYVNVCKAEQKKQKKNA